MLIPHRASPTIGALDSDSLRAVHATADALGAMVAEDDGDRRRALLARLYGLSREASVYRQHTNAIEAELMARERAAEPASASGRLVVGLLSGTSDPGATRAAPVGMEHFA